MKKVGILVNSIGYGGNERSAVNIAKALKDKFDVSIIIQEDCGNHYEYKGRVIDLHTPCARTKCGKVANSIRRILRLQKTIKTEKLDTLIIILPLTNPINYLRLKCRKIVSCRDCGDLIKRTNKYIWMTKRSDLIVCNSKYQADYLENKCPDVKDKVFVIYNILDIDKVINLKDEALDTSTETLLEGHRFIVCTSRFAQAKGLNNMVKAFSVLVKRNSELKLVLVGDGNQRKSLEKLINELGLKDQVILPGFQENPFKYMAKAEAYVLPSFYEGFPNTLIEAMSCEIPVIATDCPSGPAEILCGHAEQGYSITEYGVLVETFEEEKSTWDMNDISEKHIILADAIERIIDDEKIGKMLVKNAKLRVDTFRSDAIAAAWESVL